MLLDSLGKYCQTVASLLVHIVTWISSFHCHCCCYFHRIVPVIEITWILMDLSKLINNVIRQLAPELKKLMKETTSVFWVGLGYMLCNQKRALLQDSRRWLHLVMFIFLLLMYLIHGGTTWFSARSMGCSPGYVQDPPTAWTIFSTDQFQ